MTENSLPHPLAKKIKFSGNCPECEMKNMVNEMLLNSMDLFECPECHLQVTAFPDAVAVLKWRGEGKFRQTKLLAREGITGQRIFAASDENEILPNMHCSLVDYFDLEEYIANISPSYDNWKTEMASYEKFDFSMQQDHLETIEAEYWENLIEQWKLVQKDGIPSESFNGLAQSLYDRGVIFNFPWQSWNEGLENVMRGNMPPDTITLLEASKYLTVIFRENRFSGWKTSYTALLAQLFDLVENIT